MHHGFFVERAKNVYSFAHLTFQEYFTAKYIIDNQWKTVNESGILDENGKTTLLEYIVRKHIYNAKWKEVFLLIAGMMDSADELLLLMRREANRSLNVKEIDSLFTHAKRTLKLEPTDIPTVIRLGFSAYFILAFNRGKKGIRSNDLTKAKSIILDLVSSMLILLGLKDNMRINFLMRRSRRVTYDIEKSLKEKNNFIWEGALERGLEILNEMHITIDIENIDINNTINTSEKVVKLVFMDYLVANALICECIASGCYISNPIREKMINEIFLSKKDLEPYK